MFLLREGSKGDHTFKTLEHCLKARGCWVSCQKTGRNNAVFLEQIALMLAFQGGRLSNC